MSAPSVRFLYEVFGLRLEADRSIPGLVAIAGLPKVDVRIRFDAWPLANAIAWGNEPCYQSPFLTDDGRPIMTAWANAAGEYLRLLTSDGAAFVVDRPGTEVWIDASGVSPSRISEYLTGPVAGVVLRRRGFVCLHASAVRIGRVAVAFAGVQGTGKSTIAAAFAMRGHEVITDDLVTLVDDGAAMRVPPGAPYLRMRPGLVEGIARDLGKADDLRLTDDGRYVDLVLGSASHRIAASPVPLGAVYCLDWSNTDTSRSEWIAPMTGTEATLTLLGDTWAARIQSETDRAAELDVLARLVARVPVRRLAQTRAGHARGLVERVVDDIKAVTRVARDGFETFGGR